MTGRVVAALALAAAPLAAQIDYRNLDAGRPLPLEDAYPVEHRALEVILAYGGEREPRAPWVHTAEFELTYGLLPNTHVGVALPFAHVAGEQGLAGVGVFALYNVNTESPAWPALALRGDALLDAGSLAPQAARGAVQAIATRSFGRTRLHLSGAAGLGPQTGGAVEGVPRWRAGAALDRTLFRQSLLALASVTVLQATRGDASAWVAAAGLRWQWRPTAVLDLGVARRLGDHGPDVALTLGMTKVFGLP